jgi:hypothetical protein
MFCSNYHINMARISITGVNMQGINNAGRKEQFSNDREAEEFALIVSGQMIPPRVKELPERFWRMGGPRLSIRKAAQAVSRDREGR